jgi:phage recombination protein Bet
MSAITKYETNTLPALQMSESELIEVLVTSLYPGAQINSIKMALGYCKAAGLDPMQKPVHIVPMWDSKSGTMRDVVMPGIGLYRTQAARSGCAGVTEPEFGPDTTESIGGQQITYPAWCRVTVKRRLATGEIVDFTAREFFKENYAIKGGKDKSIAPNAMWTKRPYGQLAKCAESQALRKAFPECGAESTAEEMQGKPLHDDDTVIDASTGEITSRKPAAPAAPAALPAWPEGAFNTQFARWEKAVTAGLKTATDIVAMACSKGALTPEQEKRIAGLAKPERPTSEPTDVEPKAAAADMTDHADFLAGLDD